MRYIRLLQAAVLCLAFLIYGCAAKVPTQNDLVLSNHIPDKFNQADNLQSISNSDNETSLSPRETITTMFHDDTLDKIIEITLLKNTDILTLASKIKQAESEARKAGAAMFPTADIGLNYSVSGSSPNQNSLNLNGSLAWEADIFGKLNNLRYSSGELKKYAEENLKNAQISAMADVASYYFKIRYNAQSIKISRMLVKNLSDTLDIYLAKLEFGLVDETDVTTARMDLLNELNNLKSLEVNLEQNKNALLVLLDENTLPFDIYSDYEFSSPFIPKINDIPSQALLNRPDIKAGIYSLYSEYYKTAYNKATLLPSLSLNVSLTQILTSSTGVADFAWQIAASLTAPLFNRTNLYENLKIQEESQKQATYNLQKVINTALSEIESAVFSQNASNITLRNSNDYYDNSIIALDIVKSKNEYGLVDDQTLLLSVNQNLSAKKSVLSSTDNNITSSINLYKAFGGSFNKVKDSDEDKK